MENAAMPLHHGHHNDHADAEKDERPEQQLEVEVTLEDDIELVEQAVVSYLEHQDSERLSQLRAALERLDAQTDRSDAWTMEMARQLRWATMSTQSVIGQTSVIPHAEEIPSSELKSQVTLVKAAKEVVRHPNLQTVGALTAAQSALDAFRTQD